MAGIHLVGFGNWPPVAGGHVATDHRWSKSRDLDGSLGNCLLCREIAEYVAYHFEWDRCGVTFPPPPPPKDFQALCPSYELAVAEEAAGCFELPELSQVIFYTMLLNEAESTEQAAEYVQDNFRWSLRDPSAPGPRPLPSDYHGLCRRFDLGVATRYAHDSNMLEMAPKSPSFSTCKPTGEPCVAGRPYERNDASFPTFRNTTHAAKYVRDNLRWSFAHATRIPEMVQAIFYAMVISDAEGLRLSSRDAMGDMMLELQELRWGIVEAWLLSINERLRDAQVLHLVEMVYNPRPCPEVTSRLTGAPSLLSDEE
ncbi:hypothetical protein Cgig2_027417 [Carnegiea gigantea]|uniref:Uncharacterized protein n=1 Tax=Carnegiea gigantea TaxID=171969 RepID=A0A9Q1JP87_9CARY|nr:hypothetical protein Cgig2_027417 [Carnegiea gigantea]